MLTEDNRRRATEMTEDLSIWEGPAVSMAVVLLEYMDRVKELEEDKAIRAYKHVELVNGLRDRITELKSAQTPRPMSEAPRDRTPILVVMRSQLSAKGFWTTMSQEGWLPCPPDPEMKS